jgi:hypothetical protein
LNVLNIRVLALVTLTATAASASQVEHHVVDSYAKLEDGELPGTTLTPQGLVVVGPAVKTLVKDAAGPILALCRSAGVLYYATSGEAAVYRKKGTAAPEKLAELETPVVAKLVCSGDEVLAVGSGEKPGVWRVKGKKATLVAAEGVKGLFDGVRSSTGVIVVGADEEGGVVLRLEGDKLEKVRGLEGAPLRSVAVQKTRGKERLLLGGQKNGVVYALEGGKLRALFDAEANEVTAIAGDKDGNVYAAIVDADGKLTPSTKKKDEKKPKKRKPRKIKSSEVIHIDADGRARTLWQSKRHGAYDLALTGSTLVVGTGAEGRLLRIDVRRDLEPGVWTHIEGHDEVIALAKDGDGLLIGTAHPGAVHRVAGGARAKGAYLSPVLDAKSMAQIGRVEARTRGGKASVRVRTGNTKKVDETWSAFSPKLLAAGNPIAPRGRYAQVEVELKKGVQLSAVRLAFLPDNRKPRVEKLEVLAPGWRVRSTPREKSENRSVTFNGGAFKRFLNHTGVALPRLTERGGGKQVKARGYRTVYAWVVDDDKDQLRYRFFLARVDKAGSAEGWEYVKEWSKEPFYSFDASKLADGDYRVRVEVDDRLTNGQRALADSLQSPLFAVRHQGPRFQEAKSERRRGGVRLRFVVDAELPLSVVRCAVGDGPWDVVAPTDGILDAARERFDVTLQGRASFGSASCEAVDEALNTSRVDLNVR